MKELNNLWASAKTDEPDPKVFRLNLAERKINLAHKSKMPAIVGILTFIRVINTTSERF